MNVTVKIENAYEDGHESTHEVIVELPDDTTFGDLDGWFEDVVWEHTGDGHGADKDLGYCHTATIIAADQELLLGIEYEWAGS